MLIKMLCFIYDAENNYFLPFFSLKCTWIFNMSLHSVLIQIMKKKIERCKTILWCPTSSQNKLHVTQFTREKISSKTIVIIIYILLQVCILWISRTLLAVWKIKLGKDAFITFTSWENKLLRLIYLKIRSLIKRIYLICLINNTYLKKFSCVV